MGGQNAESVSGRRIFVLRRSAALAAHSGTAATEMRNIKEISFPACVAWWGESIRPSNAKEPTGGEKESLW